jgi:hypothetical protein
MQTFFALLLPSALLDGQRVPYTLSSRTKHKYLSIKYPPSEIDSVCAVGVKVLSRAEFLEDPATMISKDASAFQ